MAVKVVLDVTTNDGKHIPLFLKLDSLKVCELPKIVKQHIRRNDVKNIIILDVY